MKGFVWSSLQHGPAGHKVYALVDSRGPEVFYVGCSYNLYQRMHDHRAGNTTNLAMKLRAADIKASGATMDMVILERTEDLAREPAWIDFFRPYGLMNSIEHQSPARPTKRALPLAA
jgi:predicted GIY-YIG superfamily endonuclease